MASNTKTSVRKQKASSRLRLNKRSMWKGSISFGLVNVPVELFSAKDGEQLSFNMLDKRDHGRIGYKQINKITGKEIDRSQIVKGYEYQKGEYVLITDEDFQKANAKASKTIEIEDFVLLDEVDVVFFDKPYYLVPVKAGIKGYALLRRVLEKTGKVAIGKIVISKKQHLAALIVRNEYIVLELLRFADDVLALKEGDIIGPEIEDAQVSDKELAMAEQLVASLTTSWEPNKYRDTYKDDLLQMIQTKIKNGNTAVTPGASSTLYSESNSENVFDISALLRKSLQAAKDKSSRSRRKA